MGQVKARRSAFHDEAPCAGHFPMAEAMPAPTPLQPPMKDTQDRMTMRRRFPATSLGFYHERGGRHCAMACSGDEARVDVFAEATSPLMPVTCHRQDAHAAAAAYLLLSMRAFHEKGRNA